MCLHTENSCIPWGKKNWFRSILKVNQNVRKNYSPQIKTHQLPFDLASLVSRQFVSQMLSCI